MLAGIAHRIDNIFAATAGLRGELEREQQKSASAASQVEKAEKTLKQALQDKDVTEKQLRETESSLNTIKVELTAALEEEKVCMHVCRCVMFVCSFVVRCPYEHV